ncbi:transposase family protein [Streptomyces sp. NPDC001774]
MCRRSAIACLIKSPTRQHRATGSLLRGWPDWPIYGAGAESRAPGVLPGCPVCPDGRRWSWGVKRARHLWIMEFFRLQNPRGAVLVASSSPMPMAPSCVPSLVAVQSCREPVVPVGLLPILAAVPDPRDLGGVHYRLATLLAIGICAMTAPGCDPLAAIAEWAGRCGPQTLADLGCPFDPLAGRSRCPDGKTLRDACGKTDPGELTRAGCQRLADLVQPGPDPPAPDGLPERGQRRAHRAAALDPPVPQQHRRFAVERQVPSRKETPRRQPDLSPVRGTPRRRADGGRARDRRQESSSRGDFRPQFRLGVPAMGRPASGVGMPFSPRSNAWPGVASPAEASTDR